MAAPSTRRFIPLLPATVAAADLPPPPVVVPVYHERHRLWPALQHTVQHGFLGNTPANTANPTPIVVVDFAVTRAASY